MKGSSQCPGEEDVSVNVHGKTLTFTNSQFHDYVAHFSPKPDGSFGGIYRGSGRPVIIKARIVGNTLDADVSSPPCKDHWHLKKQ